MNFFKLEELGSDYVVWDYDLVGLGVVFKSLVVECEVFINVVVVLSDEEFDFVSCVYYWVCC